MTKTTRKPARKLDSSSMKKVKGGNVPVPVPTTGKTKNPGTSSPTGVSIHPIG